MPDESHVSHWIQLVKEGDSVAASELWRHYFDRLVRAVRVRLGGQNRAPSDEEDIVLSVFNSFYDAAQQGRFPDLADRDSLWQVLLRMSVRKVIDKRRHDQRIRRGGEHVLHSIEVDEENRAFHEIVGNEPSPEMILMMQEAVEQLFSHLGDGQLRDLAGAKLEGYTNAELASKFECSERTIERRLHLIREKCQQELIDKDERTTTETLDRGAGKD
ncbi:MAG TPA: RNA polymerase subunit sigma-70 [Planctomycetaceae bacterium]|nr:RNA polymerase subunit sigma-70 [Planctomycetaceae bacterium]